MPRNSAALLCKQKKGTRRPLTSRAPQETQIGECLSRFDPSPKRRWLQTTIEHKALTTQAGIAWTTSSRAAELVPALILNWIEGTQKEFVCVGLP